MRTWSLAGRSAIITGSSQGIGLEMAVAYVEAGCNVLLCARQEEMLRVAEARVRAAAGAPCRLLAVRADVTSPTDVSALVARALTEFGDLHILVNNAGVYGPKGPVEDADWEEWTQAIAVNLMGSVLCCRSVIPHFRAQGYGKIIQMSGGGATAPLPRLSAYAASKAAVVRFAETLAEELRDAHVDVNCIAPGMLNTRMLDEVLAAGPDKVGARFYEKALKQKQAGGTPLSTGARLAVFLGSAASDGITGKLISAVWDPWETLDEHRAELASTDVYTLRRIVPTDRGLPWGGKP